MLIVFYPPRELPLAIFPQRNERLSCHSKETRTSSSNQLIRVEPWWFGRRICT
ncbi:hypothetical protein HOLleu_31529 [Holothuria leucospilota]|uniref:Uncharacterized protein n=1 Tax=Holothuria leucospilota TaxID=206669 RepID=A0A9Q0YRW5_HOLLE|nr:hypothetical protein HOLleu_31529 [Holothuria leucospilota]